MADQSRADAVELALRAHMNANGAICSKGLAQAAIEASDAWLKAHPTWVCPNCGTQEPFPYQAECRGCGDFNPYSETIS